MALITKAEIIDMSMTNKSTDPYLIKDSFITRAELDYIQPALGEDLYNLLLAGSLTGKNLILYNSYIKPAMAYFVKYLCLPDMYLNTTSSGLQINNREFSSSGTAKDRAELATSTMNMAVSFLNNGIKYIEHIDNYTYFTTYTTSNETKVNTRIIGGILFE